MKTSAPAASWSSEPSSLAARLLATWNDRICWLLFGLALVTLLLPRPVRVRGTQPLQTVLLAPLRVAAWLRQNLTDLATENRRLTSLAAELAVENARLVARSGTTRTSSLPGEFRLIYCPIIGRDMSTLERFLIASRGTRHGIATGTCAITADGVVGRVVAAGLNQALIQTILDPDSRIAVMNLRSRALAIARPEGRHLVLDYVPDTTGMAAGDTLVTSGLGLVFPKGLRVGVIATVADSRTEMFRQIDVKPFVQLLRLEGVFVLARNDSFTADDGWLNNLSPAQVRIPSQTTH